MKNLILMSTLAFGVTAFGMTPPQLPANMPPLQKPPVVKLRPAANRVTPNSVTPKQTPRPIDRETIESMAIDANVKRFLLEQLEGAGRMAPAGELPANDEFLSRRRLGLKSDALRAVADTTILASRQATNDSTQEYEPAVIVNRFSNVDWTTTVFMKYDSNNVPQLHSYSTDGTSSVSRTLGLPANHTWGGDPILSENPYVSSGVAPKRTYCSGISLQINSDNTVESAVNVWATDNTSTTGWTLNTIDTATTNVSSNKIQLDKPSNWTSWHTGTLGYNYVAAVAVNMSNSANTAIRVYRKTSTLGGWTHVSSPVTGSNVQSPIITVDINTGYVYLLWINWGTSQISIAQSTDMGSTFGTPVSFNAGTNINGGGGYNCNSTGANCIRATTVIMARPNATDNSIGVVWHRRESSTNNANTDVYFNSFALATQTWRGEVRLNDWTTGDQWNPALDPDANGNYMTMWYDRRDDSADSKYIVYGARIDGSGNALEAGNVIVHTNIRASDSTRLTAINDNNNVPRRYIGEYQDLWEWFGTWHGVTIYAPDQSTGGNGNPDVFLPRIQP